MLMSVSCTLKPKIASSGETSLDHNNLNSFLVKLLIRLVFLILLKCAASTLFTRKVKITY